MFASNYSKTPHIASTFNGWHLEKMVEVVQYCLHNDLDPPNFEEECITDSLIRAEHAGRLNADERRIVNLRAEAYYNTHWPTVLMRMLRFKKP